MPDTEPTAPLSERLADFFDKHFGEEPSCAARAPGRVNLIGEHTDYNAGFVLPMAIDLSIGLAVRPSTDRHIRLMLHNPPQEINFSLDNLERGSAGTAQYIKGVAWVLQEAGHNTPGFEGVLIGDIPIAAGLSSSAALEIATARVFCALANIDWDPLEMALLAQRAENEWVGVQCGIMDQLSSACGLADHALLIDCRSLEIKPAPLPADLTVVIMDTGVRRELATSAYNQRRRTCEQAAALLGVKTLRDVDLELLARRQDQLDTNQLKRARHVVTENQRTLQFHEALCSGATQALGWLMRASHASLRDDYQVSCDELDTIIELANQHSGCLGARMTGAGFGGCAIALVQKSEAIDFIEAVSSSYDKQLGITAKLFMVSAAGAVSLS
jgi:galactokinase